MLCMALEKLSKPRAQSLTINGRSGQTHTCWSPRFVPLGYCTDAALTQYRG
jgi:hypothetical protein